MTTAWTANWNSKPEEDSASSARTWLRACMRHVSVMLLLITGIAAHAQTSNATIVGEVKDSTGAFLPGSTVTAVNRATGLTKSTTADNSGRYTIVELTPGTYDVRVEHGGFSSILQRNQELLVGTTNTLNFSLKVSAITETVEVNAASVVQIQSTESTVSRILETPEIDSLPVLNRQFATLAILTPGVQSNGVNQASTSSVTSATVSIGNSPNYSTSYLVDGVSNETGNQGGPYVQLAQDWVQEFSVLALQFPAEYGNAAGGVINAVTRSGTNAVRGRAYGFFQNAALNSNPEFYTGTTKAPFSSERVGGMVGGPILKDKLFYFAGFEYFHNINTNTLASVGTTAPWASTAQPVGTPASALVPWLIYGTDASDQTTIDSRLAMLRLDYTPNQKDSISLRSNLDYEYVDAGVSGATSYGAATSSYAPAYAETATWVRTFSPRTVNEAHFAFLSIGLNRISRYANAKGTYAGVTLNPQPYNYISTTALGGPTTLGNPVGNWASVGYNAISTGAPTLFGVTAGDGAGILSDTWTRVAGKHTFKAGAMIRRYMSWGNNDNNNSNGGYRFGSTPGPFNPTASASLNGNVGNGVTGAPLLNLITQAPVAGNFTTGTQRAPTSYSVAFACCPPAAFQRFYFPSYSLGFFFQDSWRARENLTLNYGLRYDINNSNSSLAKAAFPPLQAVDPGSSGFIRSGWHKINNDPFDIAPRIGFAWTPLHDSEQTVIRGGFGLFYDQANNANDPIYEGNNSVDTGGGFSIAANVATQNPYCIGNTLCTSKIPLNFELAVLDVLASGLANYTLPTFPTSTSPCAATNSCTVTVGANTYTIPALSVPYNPQGGIVDIDHNYKTPGTLQATIGVQHAFSKTFNVSVDFVYHRGYNGIVSVNSNVALTGLGASQTFTTINPAYTSIKAFSSLAFSDNKDLQVQAHYQDHRSDLVQVAYQFGYATDNSVSNFLVSSVNATTTNPFDLNYDRGPSVNDARHILNASGNFNLRWGFFLSPLVSVTSALPYTASSTLQAPGSASAPPGCLPYFAKCYPVVNGVTYSRNSLRGDPFFSLSARVSKNIKFTEHKSLLLLIEGFNLTNKHNLGTNFFSNVDAANFQTPNGTSLPLRQLQVGARFDF